MPSYSHEAMLLLLRSRADLAPRLLHEWLHMQLPEYVEARIESANLTDIRPAEYRADLVIVLETDRPVFGIVVEVQLSRDDNKLYTWPSYVVNLRSRFRCPVLLLVICVEEVVARWARQPIELGGESRIVPRVLSPSDVPEIVDRERAKQDPEMAVLSAMSHGRDSDIAKAVRIAVAAKFASARLDSEQSALYFDFIDKSLSEAALKAVKDMRPADYQYQSDFARTCFGQGSVETWGKMASILLTRRFGPLPETVKTRIISAQPSDLESAITSLLTAPTLEDVLKALT